MQDELNWGSALGEAIKQILNRMCSILQLETEMKKIGWLMLQFHKYQWETHRNAHFLIHKTFFFSIIILSFFPFYQINNCKQKMVLSQISHFSSLDESITCTVTVYLSWLWYPTFNLNKFNATFYVCIRYTQWSYTYNSYDTQHTEPSPKTW